MKKRRFGQLVIILYYLLGLFAFPHLIDDFLFGIPKEFGISVQTAQVLSGIFLVLYGLILTGLALRRRIGYYGSAALGIFLALAGVLKHLPRMIQPEPYWSGAFSEGLIAGMIICGICLAIVSLLALRQIDNYIP